LLLLLSLSHQAERKDIWVPIFRNAIEKYTSEPHDGHTIENGFELPTVTTNSFVGQCNSIRTSQFGVNGEMTPVDVMPSTCTFPFACSRTLPAMMIPH
jgi:hypothetical protein